MIELAAIGRDVLETGKLAVTVIERHDQPTVASHARSVRRDAFGFQVGVIIVSWPAFSPDGLNGADGYFILAGRLCVAGDLGFRHAPNMHHFLGMRWLAPYVGAPV